jgi:hypothetical protein
MQQRSEIMPEDEDEEGEEEEEGEEWSEYDHEGAAEAAVGLPVGAATAIASPEPESVALVQ